MPLLLFSGVRSTIPILGVVETEVERTTPTPIVASEYPVPSELLKKHPHLKAVIVVGFGLRKEGFYDGDVLFVDPTNPASFEKLYVLDDFTIGRFELDRDTVGFVLMNENEDERYFNRVGPGGPHVLGEIVMQFSHLGEYYADRKTELEKEDQP